MEMVDGFEIALKKLTEWLGENIDKNKTRIFFAGSSPAHSWWERYPWIICKTNTTIPTYLTYVTFFSGLATGAEKTRTNAWMKQSRSTKPDTKLQLRTTAWWPRPSPISEHWSRKAYMFRYWTSQSCPTTGRTGIRPCSGNSLLL